MAVLLLFFLIVLGICALILYTNKSPKAEIIKNLLNKVFVNLKDLTLNLRDLYKAIVDLFRNEADEDQTQPSAKENENVSETNNSNNVENEDIPQEDNITKTSKADGLEVTSQEPEVVVSPNPSVTTSNIDDNVTDSKSIQASDSLPVPEELTNKDNSDILE